MGWYPQQLFTAKQVAAGALFVFEQRRAFLEQVYSGVPKLCLQLNTQPALFFLTNAFRMFAVLVTVCQYLVSICEYLIHFFNIFQYTVLHLLLHVSPYLSVSLSLSIYIHIHIYICMHIYVYTHLCIYAYVCL